VRRIKSRLGRPCGAMPGQVDGLQDVRSAPLLAGCAESLGAEVSRLSQLQTKCIKSYIQKLHTELIGL
jgi:hypothetical protein